MTQLDIPPISFARYLELLKRRRWQVIPVTILGLLLGAMVAFLIPRYYVAATEFTFHGELIDAPIGSSQEDPMRAVVDSAKVLLPNTVPAVLESLAWPEAKDEDQNRRRSFIESVKDRVTVEDPLGGYRDQLIVNLKVNYRDTNGQRAADMANGLRDLFISTQRARLIARVRKSLDDVQEEVEAATLAVENASTDLRNHRSEFGIDPLFDQIGDIGAERGLREDLRNEAANLAKFDGQLAAARDRLRGRKEMISSGKVKPRRQVASSDPLVQELASEQRAVRKQVQLLQLRLSNLKPAHPDYRLLEMEIERFSTLLSLDPSGTRSQILTEPNPQYIQLQLDISELESTVIGLVGIQAQQQQVVIDLQLRLDELPEVWGRYDAFKNAYNEALADKENIRERENSLLERFDAVDNEDAFEILSYATVPPAPTEPSIFVVAALGSLIGLVQAIALILLVDFLQSTFKTVDDVERGLSLPVLGGMAYLQTREERVKAKEQRRKVALISTAFLVLSLAVILIYYLSPTSLPRVVYQAMDMVLGGTG